MFRALFLLSATLLLANAATARDDRAKSSDTSARDAPSARVESARSKERSDGRAALPAERRDMQPADDEPVPVANPRRSVIPGTEAGAPPTVINPEQGRIRITALTALPDVASGRRQARVRFSANVPITHFRAVQVTSGSLEAPFAGIPWQSYSGGDPVVTLLGCGVHYPTTFQETIAVQLKGEDIPNPNLAGSMMENGSHVQRVDVTVPPALRSRITTKFYLNPPVYGDNEPVDIGEAVSCSQPQHCFIVPGQPTNSRVQVLQLYVENYPGVLTADAIRHDLSNCMIPVHAHDVHSLGAGRARFTVDAEMRGNVCEPKLVLGACGRAVPAAHTRTIPIRFERQTIIHSNSAEANGMTVDTSCETEEREGDISITTTEGVCNVQVRGTRDARLELNWKSEQEGNCRLNAPLKPPIPPTVGGYLYTEALNRRSDFHPGYDRYPPFDVVNETLNQAAVLTAAQPHRLNQGCYGAPYRTNRVRTWIDRIEVSRWRYTRVHTVR